MVKEIKDFTKDNKTLNLNRFELGQNFNHNYLTKRELEVLKYIVFGYSAKKIALILNISFRTVETYTEILKLKLDCYKKSEIIEKSIKTGLFSLLIIEDIK